MNPKYKQLYLTEADEKLQGLNQAVLALEKDKSDLEAANNAMRAAHTLKSSSAAMEQHEISTLAHTMEDFFEKARTHKTNLTEQDIDHLFQSIDGLKKAVEAFRGNKTAVSLASYISLLKGETSAEDLGLKTEMKENTSSEEIHEIRIPVETADQLMNVTEELLVEQMHLAEILRTSEDAEQSVNLERLRAVAETMQRLTADLQYYVTDIRLIPLGQVFHAFPRAVRDLAKSSDKQVKLSISGQDIELDRSIIDRMGEPIMHLLRNAVDHGIAQQGTVTLRAARAADTVIVDVEDDGVGIDWSAVKDSAIARGIIKRSDVASLGEDGLEELIFHPQLSTSAQVTETSGRGVGLSVVKTVITGFGGTVSVGVPEGGQGTRFRLRVPITLAIVKALLVKVQRQVFAIPFVQVDRSVRIQTEEIKKAMDQEMVVVQGEEVALVRLSEMLGAQVAQTETLISSETELVVIVRKNEDEVLGLIVDELITEQEIVVKALTGMIRQVGGFAGVTLLGDGKPALILDVASLV
jgi:two-component system, chemotaxis family, sensor kinase CheA